MDYFFVLRGCIISTLMEISSTRLHVWLQGSFVLTNVKTLFSDTYVMVNDYK